MAFSYKIPDHVLLSSLHLSIQSKLGHRNDGSDGSEAQQLVGIIGENSIRYLFNLPLMEKRNDHDGGYDITIHGKNFDVKTMGRTVDPKLDFVNNFVLSQTAFNPDAYIFTSLNKTNLIITICGWIPSHNLKQNMERFHRGETRKRTDGSKFTLKADLGEIPNSKLNYNFYDIEQLDESIKQWAESDW